MSSGVIFFSGTMHQGNKVGIVSEIAKYNLSSQEEVLPFLEKLSGEGVSYGTTSKSIKGQLKATVDFFKGLWTNKK